MFRSAKLIIFFFPKITLLLIIFNVIFYYSSISRTSDLDVSTCIAKNYPECVERMDVSNQENLDLYHKCLSDFFKNGGEGNPEYCYYGLNTTCVLANNALVNCSFRNYKGVYVYGFIPNNLKKGVFLTLVSSMFMHVDFSHLFFNMLFLFIIGGFIESRLGTKNYLLLYFWGGISAALYYYLWNMHSVVPLVGASGAIFALAGANLIINNRTEKKSSVEVLAVFFKIRSKGFSARFLAVLFFYQFLYALLGIGGNVAFSAHIGGFIFGMFSAIKIKAALAKQEKLQRIEEASKDYEKSKADDIQDYRRRLAAELSGHAHVSRHSEHRVH